MECITNISAAAASSSHAFCYSYHSSARLRLCGACAWKGALFAPSTQEEGRGFHLAGACMLRFRLTKEGGGTHTFHMQLSSWRKSVSWVSLYGKAYLEHDTLQKNDGRSQNSRCHHTYFYDHRCVQHESRPCSDPCVPHLM